MKVCTKCNVLKDLDLFHKDPSGKGGRSAQCKVCRVAAVKAYNDKDPVRHRKLVNDIGGGRKPIPNGRKKQRLLGRRKTDQKFESSVC